MKYSRLLFAITLPIFTLALFMVTLQTKASPAATFTVNSTVDAVDVNPGDGVCETGVGNGTCTLRAAVMEANEMSGDDTITIPPNIYQITILGQEEDANISGDIDITDDLILAGGGAETTIIDGGFIDRVFHITGKNNIEVTFSNITIQNGGVDNGTLIPELHGAGIYNALPSNIVLISDSILINNIAQNDSFGSRGGAIYNAGIIQITNTDILSNTSPGGHGIYNSGTLSVTMGNFGFNNITSGGGPGGTIQNDGSLFITDASFHNNISYTGGSVHNGPSGIASVINTDIYSNSVYLDGGGIFNFGTITVTNSSIYSNTTTSSRGGGIINLSGQTFIINSMIHHNDALNGFGFGGGIFLDQGSIEIRESDILSNNALFGGGIYNEGGELLIIDSTIAQNLATTDGGGILNYGQLEGINLTISQNEALGNGGGIWQGTEPTTSDETATLTNVTLAENSASNGLNIHLIVSPYVSTISIVNTIIASNAPDNCNVPLTATSYSLESGNSCGLSGIGDMTNIEPLLEILTDNGGSTMTHALLVGSPAIDSGDNNNCPLTDQRRVTRPLDGNDDGTAVCDIGAYEAEKPPKMIYLPFITKP